MRSDSEKKVTGLNLYLALSKLELILAQGECAMPLPDAEITAAVVHYDLACVSDFRAQSGVELCSELFTARAVGELIVKVAVEEGVIRLEGGHGLAVRLHAELSPVLSSMLVSFNRCLGGVLGFLAGVPRDAHAALAMGGRRAPSRRGLGARA